MLLRKGRLCYVGLSKATVNQMRFFFFFFFFYLANTINEIKQKEVKKKKRRSKSTKRQQEQKRHLQADTHARTHARKHARTHAYTSRQSVGFRVLEYIMLVNQLDQTKLKNADKLVQLTFSPLIIMETVTRTNKNKENIPTE